MKIPHDLHVHTYLSDCCGDREHQRPAAILKLAEEMGVGTIGFADHVWVNPDLEPSDWYRPQDETQIERLRADLAQFTSSVRPLVGCEAEMLGPGRIGLTPEFARTLDYVLLSCSHLHMAGFVDQPASEAPVDIAKHLLNFFRAGVTSGIPTSIAHPFLPLGRIQHLDAIVASVPDEEFLDAFGLAAGHGVALEVTVGFVAAPTGGRFSEETPVRFLSLAKKAGCKFTFGSDAHDPEGQKQLPKLERLVEAVGITEEDVLRV